MDGRTGRTGHAGGRSALSVRRTKGQTKSMVKGWSARAHSHFNLRICKPLQLS